MREHHALLQKVCTLYCESLHDRQDLFQEIVIQVWKSYPGFRGEAKFSTWLYRIALNTAISDLRRKKKRTDRVRDFNMADFPAGLAEMKEESDKEERLQQLYTAIGRLTEVEKAMVMLWLEEKSYEEMEDILGINQNNLRVRMNRIKEKLRKIAGEGKDDGTGKS